MIRYDVLSCLVVATSAIADNPVVSHRHLADPNAFVHNGRIYAICSNDDYNGSGYDMKGSVLISTRDLANWTDHGEVFYAPKDTKWATLAYAPTAAVRNGKVYYYIPNNTGGIAVLVADRPEGPLKDPLGKALISGSLCDGVEWCFDPAVFVDDDGQAYLSYGGGSNSTWDYGKNIRIIKLNSDMISSSGSPYRLTLQKSFEGPFLHKYKGGYYMHYPMSDGANIGCSRSSSPTSGYTYIGSILDNPSLNGSNVNMYNNSHESVFEYEGAWYMMYHDRRLTLSRGTNNYLKRSVSIDKLVHNADGTIQKVAVTDGMAQLRPFDPYDSISALTCSKQSNISAWTDVNNSGVRRVNLMIPRKSGAWMRISGVDFGAGAKEFRIHGGGAASNAKVEVRTGSSTGTIAGTCSVSKTGSWTSLATSKCAMTNLSGVVDVYLTFSGTDSNTVFDWFRWVPEDSGSTRAISAPPTEGKVLAKLTWKDLRGKVVALDEQWIDPANPRIASPDGLRGVLVAEMAFPGKMSRRARVMVVGH